MRWDRSKGRPEPIRALNKVPERENGEPMVNLNVVAPSVKLIRPTTIAYCRESVAQMAELAARSLPPGFFLAVTDAWRPIERQRRIYDWMTACAKEAFPHLDYPSIRRRVNRWVAPVDQKAPPGHCTGAALDVALVDEYGNPCDVCSPYDRFRACSTYTLGLSVEAERNRSLLVEAMLGAGFSNCRDEWWHYSYGDAGWAVRLEKDECFYGCIELSIELYSEQDQLWYESFKDRPNPFLSDRS